MIYRFGLALGVICLGGVGGFFAAHLLHHPTVYSVNQESTAATGRPGAASTPDSSAGAEEQPPQPRTVPETLPDITLPDMQGKNRSLSAWKGHPLLVNFWATWCAPCRQEIPLLEKLRRERAGDGVEVIGIAVDFRDAVQRYAHAMHIDYPVLIGEQDGLSAIAAFGMDTVFPFTIFADSRGRILTLKVGELHPDEARFILDRLRDVDRGGLDLAVARRQVADGVARLAAQRARAQVGPGTDGSVAATPGPDALAAPGTASSSAARATNRPNPR